MTLGRAVGLSLAGLMVLVGALWTGQGLGWVDGSPMTGEPFWAIAGPVVAGLGVALAISVIGHARQQARQDPRYGGRR